MPVSNYGVLKGHAIDRKVGKGDTPHYQIHILSEQKHYRIAINVKSQSNPSTVLCDFNNQFDHPILDKLKSLSHDFTPLKSLPDTPALDYIRSNLFDRNQMKPLVFHVDGPFNDLNDKLDRYVQRAMTEKDAVIYAFGSRWGPENGKADRYFGFEPGNGVHDIHMNQGNSERWKHDDGIFQDGALMFHFPSNDQWVAVFTSFQSQSFDTDNRSGHAQSTTPEKARFIKISAVLASSAKQSVTLLNKSPEMIQLKNWILLNGKRDKQTINQDIQAGNCLKIELHEGFLSKKGDLLSLEDDQGCKIDGVSFTEKKANKSGWTMSF